jgi:5'-3' exoribonuclease 2
MQKVAACLRFYVQLRLNADLKWKNISVILSDSSVPGEGEHKIIEFIRGQRCASGHAPNIKHVVYSPDSDLILLGLASHEEVSILRKIKKKMKLCEICRLPGKVSLFRLVDVKS